MVNPCSTLICKLKEDKKFVEDTEGAVPGVSPENEYTFIEMMKLNNMNGLD